MVNGGKVSGHKVTILITGADDGLSMVAWVCANGHWKCSNHHQANFQIEHLPYNIFALTLNI
jgi:hypothetical protein